jgi:excisionase family DNA binding protein
MEEEEEILLDHPPSHIRSFIKVAGSGAQSACQGEEMANHEFNRRTATGFDAVVQRVMTVQDVSVYLRVHTSTVYRLLKRNELPAFRVGSDWRFNVEAIDRWRSQMESGAHVLDR